MNKYPFRRIDLVIQSGEKAMGVQCKYWKAHEVGVKQVRELMGALQDARIGKGVIVSITGFTEAARELAGRAAMELLGRSVLIGMLNEARFTPHMRELRAIRESDEKYCPRCERELVPRRSRKDGGKFWGCSSYPRCGPCWSLVEIVKPKQIRALSKLTNEPFSFIVCAS